MIRVPNIKVPLNADMQHIKKKVAHKLHVRIEEIEDIRIYRRSVDARKKNDGVYYVYTLDVVVKKEAKVLKENEALQKTPKIQYQYPAGEVMLAHPPVVVGFGPAGMFAALLLAQMGLKPLVLERGEDVDARVQSVEAFWKEGILNPKSNVQFGEGGAGAFSDGKLTTCIKDPRCKKVLEELVKAGAPEEILFDAKPHIGTDKLTCVVKAIREEIIRLGGCVQFSNQVTDILHENGAVTGLVINETQTIATEDVIFAIGHSARDTFSVLYDRGFAMEQKPFAVGVRIEHLQKCINEAQYKDEKAEEVLGAADYKLTYTTKSKRGVYSFCMCPGGYVVAAASEQGRLAVNGMSYHSRNGENGNSALLVQVTPADFSDSHPLAGIAFQRELEEKAFASGGGCYHAPAQRLGEFLGGEISTQPQDIAPTYRPGVTMTSLEDIFPSFVTEALREAIPQMGRQMAGFDNPNALLTAVESRSSSPVRIVRDIQSAQSVNCKGMYPVGEGAGYAGGIISAAVDGIWAAEKLFCNHLK